MLSMGVKMGLSGSGSNAPFTPSDLPGLIAWLNASASATLSAGRIVTIADGGDSGGNWARGTNAQVPGQGLGPLYSANGIASGKPGLTFDGSQLTTLKLPVSVTGAGIVPQTIICRARLTADQTDVSTIGSLGGVGNNTDAEENDFFVFAETDSPGQTALGLVYIDDAAAEAVAISSDQVNGVYTLSAIVDAVNVTFRVNGVQADQEANIATGAFAVDQCTVGGLSNASAVEYGQYFSGVIGHFMVWNRALSLTEIQAVEAWLAAQ